MLKLQLVLFAILLLIGCVVALESNSQMEPRAEEASHRTSTSTSSHSSGSSHSTPAPTPAPARHSSSSSSSTTRHTTTTGHATPAPTSAPTHKPTSRPTAAPTQKASSSSSSSSSGGSTTGLCDLTPTSSEPIKLLVPLYVDPGSAWTTVATGAASVPTIAIINPNSGPDANPDSSYTSGMAQLNSAGVEIIGYVHTSYGDRALSDVEADIDTYAAQYPLLKGIFIDEASDSASEVAYYTSVYNYIMSKGYVHCILNPGTEPTAAYVDISTSIVVFEDSASNFAQTSFSSFVTCAPSSAEKSGYKYKFSAIAYSAASSSASSLLSSMQTKGIGMVYVTDGASGCCTYNELVSYYSTEVSNVKSMN